MEQVVDGNRLDRRAEVVDKGRAIERTQNRVNVSCNWVRRADDPALNELKDNGFMEEVNLEYFGPGFTITYDDLE